MTDEVGLVVVVYCSYNRFRAEVGEQGQGRLRWVVVPLLRSTEDSISELNFAKEHGAGGLFFKGIERDRTMDDPYFSPVYQKAAPLDMPVCVHTVPVD
jgi:predicted TIM-barrel fold metal-dependent hydrolase